MIKRITTIAWSVVFVALFVEVSLGVRTTYDVIHPRTATPVPTQPTPTRSIPTPTPEGWKLYTSPRLGLTLYYPATWSPVAADSFNQTALVDTFKGPDGFFELDTVQNNTVIDKLCELQSHGHSEYFGVTPRTTREQVANQPACLIEPGNDIPPQRRSQALIESPWTDPSYNYISLSTDAEHFVRILQSVALDTTRRSAATTTPAPVATPLPTQLLPTPSLLSSRFGDLTMEEYAVVSAQIDTPNHFEFTQRIPADVFARRQTQRTPDLSTRLETANRLIGPMNWRFDPGSSSDGFNAFQNGLLVKSDLRRFSSIQVNRSANDFMTVVAEANGDTWLLQRTGFTPWNSIQHFNVPPVYVADDVVSLDTVANNLSQLAVTRAGTTAFNLTLDMTNSPRLVLASLGSHWVVDANGLLFQNGLLINKSLGYDEIFNWQQLNGKPLYFFTQNGKVGISYGDSVLPLGFDEVIHTACCEPAAFNISGNSSMLWFYARRNGFWNYVELGVYPSP